jgi:hypothetical protein
MGFDQPTLHLILTVVMTAAATSLALICHLLKQDNRRLAALVRRNERGQSLSISELSYDSLLKALPVIHQDIREFVKRRSQDWNGIVGAR